MNNQHRYPMLWLLAIAVAAWVAFAAVFQIDRAVRAQGQVIPHSRTQVVQAIDGGILTALHVKEGDVVKSGQMLAELESDRALAAYEQSEAEYASKRIALVRALSELVQRKPTYGSEDRKFPEFIDAQMGIYQQRQQNLKDAIDGLVRAQELSDDELAMHRRLFESGDISRSEVMRAERQVLDLQTRMTDIRNKYLDESRKEVAKLEDELSDARFKRDDRRTVSQHTVLRAPMGGVVKSVRLNTVGGVLRLGDELMQISPVDDALIVEVKVNPSDIAYLQPGLPAKVRLDAFDSSIYGNVLGKLTYVSPDTLSEQAGDGRAQVYYRAHIQLDWPATQANGVHKSGPENLKPGLTATVDILTGSRSILSYLFKPIARAFSGALNQE